MSEITYGRGSAGLGIILGLFIYDSDHMLKFFLNAYEDFFVAYLFETFFDIFQSTRLKRLSVFKATQKTL